MIKYIGSKRVLVPWLVGLVSGLEDVQSVVDLFSGTSRVGHALKAAGYQVRANDHNAYAATLARCYVQADADELADTARALLAELARVPPAPGYVTATFCEEARFFHPDNGARIDAIRDRIAALDLPPELEAIALTSLMEAADRVDSTTGVQMAYLKQWAKRAHKPLELRLPALLPRSPHGKGQATQLEAQEAARQLRGDLVYLDPPYNQHKYVGNYHIWETLVRWDAPEAYGVARKRIDCKTRRSAFNSRRSILPALASLIERLDTRYLLLSFSNEGFVPREELVELLQARGEVVVHSRPHRRYVGARIGIYSPQGDKVGTVGHLENTEHAFLVRCRG